MLMTEDKCGRRVSTANIFFMISTESFGETKRERLVNISTSMTSASLTRQD